MALYGSALASRRRPPGSRTAMARCWHGKTDALLYAGDGIRVNSIHPGFIWTPMVAEDYRKQLGVTEEELRRRLAEAHPIGRVGDPDDVGWGVVYLASDEAKFVTGSELVIDGGYTAR